MLKTGSVILAVLLVLGGAAGGSNSARAAPAHAAERVKVKVERYDPYGGQRSFINLVCYRLMQEDPELEAVPHQQLTIQGGPGFEASRFMAIAADMAPDVYTWVVFHDLRSYSRQGFFAPLNEFIGHDTDGDGYVSDAEAIWDDWKRIPEYYRRVATVDGKIYGIPNLSMGMASLVYRKDLLRKAGVDAERPPRDWDELLLILRKLTRPEAKIPGAPVQRGQHGIALEPQGWQFCSWIWAGGGEVVMQGKTNPRTGKTHWWPQEEAAFADPETGEDLSREPTQWRAAFGGEGGLRALGYQRRLRFSRSLAGEESVLK
jgi:ABC-type glycerol-3-phosphate transport system substrate-binding protein